MAYSQKTKSENVLQLIPEATPGTLDSTATPLLLANADHDWQDVDVFDNFRQAGINGGDEYNAVIQQEVHVDVDIVPYYNLLHDELLNYVLPMPSGANDATAAGVRTRTSRLNQTGRFDRKTFSLQRGIPSDAKQGTYGLITSWSINSQRGENGKCRGKMAMVVRKSTNTTLSGWTPQNEIIRIAAQNATAGKTITLPATTLGAGGAVAVALGDTAATLLTKVKALAGYNDAGVTATGSLAAGPPVDTTDTQGGTVAGDAALWDNNANTEAPIFFSSTKQGWDFGAGKQVTVNSATVTARPGASPAGAPSSITLKGSNVAIGDSGATTLASSGTLTNTDWNATPNKKTLNITTPGAYRYYWFEFGAGLNTSGDGALCLRELELLSPSTASGFFDVTLGGALANKAQTDPTAIADNSGWSIVSTQQGSDGTGAIAVKPQPILPDHWKFYRAATLAGLANVAAAAPTVDKWELKADGLVKPRYQQDRDPSYTSHVDGGTEEVQYSLEVTLPTDSDGHCLALMTGAKAYVSTPQWWRLEALSPDGVHKCVIDFYGSIGDNVPYEYGGNVEERKFTFKLLRNSVDGYNFAVTTVMAV